MSKRKLLSLMLLALFFTFTTVNKATDGYFRHGYGIKYSALAGAGIAIPLGSMGAISNPAGIVYSPTNYEINISYFSPDRSYTINGAPSGYPGTFPLTPGTITSDSKGFFFPTLGGAYRVNNNMALGLAVYGNGGMNTDYQTATFYDPSSPSTGVNIEQIFTAVTFAYQVAEGQAFGISAVYGFQRFSAKGLASLGGFSSDAASLTGNSLSTSTGFGFKLGYQGSIGDNFKVGAAYQSKIFMSPFDRYKGLFAESGDFDVPASFSAGIGFLPNDQWTILLDYQMIQYSGVKSVANTFMPNIMTAQLGKDGGAGFGWKDMSVVKLGAMYKLNNAWTLMGGYSYGTQPIPTSEVLFNILAPAVVQHHFTLGATTKLNSNELTLAVMYAPAVTVSGANPFEAPNQQTIDLKMSQFQVEIGYAFSSF